MEWDTVIGLEVHVQLATQSKIFSGASTHFGRQPNSQACAVDLGFPGVLPVFNKQALMMAIKFGLAIDASINPISVFERKNYFYPDLPKGYQISQLKQPIVSKGYLDISLDDGQSKRIGINRAHLEEDAGKSLHQDLSGCSGIDLNRAGIPLLEVVTEPDLSSPAEAVEYLKLLHQLVVALKICDGNLQEGSFRCDANVSLKPKGQAQLGVRTEVKNLNSFRFVEKALHYEMIRHKQILEAGHQVTQETRLYDEQKQQTRSMRGKEEAHDYRYFPDPDLLPIHVTPDEVERIKGQMPELPQHKLLRLQDQYGLTLEDAKRINNSLELFDFFELVMSFYKGQGKNAANWILGALSAALNKAQLQISSSKISAQQLARLLECIDQDLLTHKLAKKVFECVWDSMEDVDATIEKLGLNISQDTSDIESLVEQLIAQYPQQFSQLKAGKDKLRGFFVGQVMKETEGKANPKQVNEMITKKLRQ